MTVFNMKKQKISEKLTWKQLEGKIGTEILVKRLDFDVKGRKCVIDKLIPDDQIVILTDVFGHTMAVGFDSCEFYAE